MYYIIKTLIKDIPQSKKNLKTFYSGRIFHYEMSMDQTLKCLFLISGIPYKNIFLINV